MPLASHSEGGYPVYELDPGPDGRRSQFFIVVEARYGGPGAPVGACTFNCDGSDAGLLPDLQIESSRDLGDGSLTVCDDSDPFGGVPRVDPPDFSATQAVANAVNDFACRFRDAQGAYSGRNGNDACTAPDRCSGPNPFCFVDPRSTIQFCGEIYDAISFPSGDTVLTARVRDVAGLVSELASIVVRVRTP